jgi:hypothetical protein
MNPGRKGTHKPDGIRISIAIVLYFWTGLVVYSQQLPRYSCLTQHIDSRKWLTQFDRKLDDEGILTQQGSYHALSISIFGILRYQDFLDTGDSACFRNVVDQYAYFCDTSRVDLTADGKGLGLPYLNPAYDMKPVWYSGMTQGTALSYLARYYLLTGDTSSIPKMRQVASFMLRPDTAGGTLGRTPEGYLWIEEYPRSKVVPQVLNGFINGLIGLHEYVLLFPEDTLASCVHDECYQSLIRTLPEYDTPDWTRYSRNRNNVSQHYMHYELNQMEHLFEIYPDSLLYLQMMLWAKSAFGRKDTEMLYYKYPLFQYAAPMPLQADGSIYFTRYPFSDSFDPDPRVYYHNHRKYPPTPAFPYALRKGRKTRIGFHGPVHFVSLEFDTVPSEGLRPFLVWDETGKMERFQTELGGNQIVMTSDRAFTGITIRGGKKRRGPLRLAGIHVQAREHYTIPRFLYARMEKKYFLKAGVTYRISTQARHISDFFIFYRSAPDEKSIPSVNWSRNHLLRGTDCHFTPAEDGVFEFDCIFPFNMPDPGFSPLEVKPAE